jgi:hypothetical protein
MGDELSLSERLDNLGMKELADEARPVEAALSMAREAISDLSESNMLCIICGFVGTDDQNPNGTAHFIINGQSVCDCHSGYVQGGDFSLSVARANTDKSERIRREAGSDSG